MRRLRTSSRISRSSEIKGTIKVDEKVVEADDNGAVQYKDNAIDALVRGEVDDYMASWLSKIGRE